MHINIVIKLFNGIQLLLQEKLDLFRSHSFDLLEGFESVFLPSALPKQDASVSVPQTP